MPSEGPHDTIDRPVNIKAQGLLNAAQFVEARYGTSALHDVLSHCSPLVRERYVSAIAINWHPMEEFAEFLAVAEKQLGRGDGRLAEEIGAAGARSNFRGITLKIAFYLAKPELLMQRGASLWKQFNDEGEMRVLLFTRHACKIEVADVGKPNWLFCCTITGWLREFTDRLGVTPPLATHTQCRARAAPRCIWDVRPAAP